MRSLYFNANIKRFLLAFIVSLFVCIAGFAQVSFVQITDPHLYDDGQEAAENKRALIDCVTEIDNMLSDGADYKFAVITGDIGIEKLVKPLLEQKEKAPNSEEVDRIRRAIDSRVTQAALDVANVLAPSRIKVWLFLPGNNDLIDEKPDTVNYYREFIKQLRIALPGKKVVDLCPTDDPDSGVFTSDDSFFFVGFNNASFTNNNDAKRISSGTDTAAIMVAEDSSKLPVTPTTNGQLKNVQQVIDRINKAGSHPVYVFYHIPEIDDPHAVLDADGKDLPGNRNLLLSDGYAWSSWFVDGRVRRRWNQVVVDNRVNGLFAGHFHDWRRDTYQNYHWLVTPQYLSPSLSKLYVCPPISVKRQGDQASQARGFQAVSIDGTGRVKANVVWYDAVQHSFADQGDRQLVLGRIYEDNEEFANAEAAYTKALDSNSLPVRQKASESLERVVSRKNSLIRRYILSPLALLADRLVTVLYIALPASLVIFLVWWGAGEYGERTGKGKIEIVPFTDSTKDKLGANFTKVFEFVIGIMHLHYRARGPMTGMLNLPVIARSQYAEIAELVESSVPGGFGKALAWVTKRIHQPEYAIYGAVQVDGATLTVLVILERDGKTIASWSESTAMPTGGGASLLEVEESLAFRVLIFLKERMN